VTSPQRELSTLHVLSGGAAQAIVRAIEEDFRTATGASVHGTFGAVGAMREKLLAGERCDAVILTAALVTELERAGRVLPGSGAPLGRVRTGVAVRAGEPMPDIADGAALRATLLAAAGIYFPDPKLATAGIHFVNVLRKLGIDEIVAPRLSPHPNGATAMRELAAATGRGLVGCTQITEIKYTPGVVLVGPLPAEFELSTVYTVAVCTGAREPRLARRFTELLSGATARPLREGAGFE
jgi:molybdate transport system substrate-binding protein